MRRPGSIALPCVLALLASAATAPRTTAQEGRRENAPFTDTERVRLRAGELIARNVSRREGRYRMVGGTSWQLVRAPLDEVWAAVLDTSRYHRFIPSLQRVHVIEDNEDERLVQMHHAYSFASADYYARMRIDAEDHELRFDLDRSRPHDLRAGRGFLRLTPYRGDTIVAWGVLADVGAGVVSDVFGPFLHDWMLRVPRCVRDEIEPGHPHHC